MERLLCSLIFCLGLSASVLAQHTAFFDTELGDFVIEFDITEEADLDLNQKPWIIPESGYVIFPAEFTEGKIALSHPSDIFMYTNSQANFIAVYWDVFGGLHYTDPVNLKTPETEIVLDHNFDSGFVHAKAKIVGLEDANLSPYYDDKAYGEETFFVFFNTSMSFQGGNTYFFARAVNDFTFEGSLNMDGVVSKGILSFGVTFKDKFGIPRLADTELKCILNQEGLRAVSNPSKFGVYQVFFPGEDLQDIQVLSLSGQKLMTCRIYSGEHIILDELPTGMYLLHLEGQIPAKVIRGTGS